MPSLARRIVLTAAAVLALLGVNASAWATGSTVTVVNGTTTSPWIKFDTNGNGLDAHDGEIKQFGHYYYLYGTSYGCGYIRFHRPATPFCGFTVYRSPDLRHWTYVRKLFNPYSTSPTDWQGICNSMTLSCYRPHVLYNAATKKYVLWVNTYDTDAAGVQHGYHVLTSSYPAGPFTEVTDSSGHAAIPTLAYPTGGDFDLYQDDDVAHSAYIVYTVRVDPLQGVKYGYELVVEKLSSDYTNSGGAFSTLETINTEAPSMFKRNGIYYITMANPNCAYCGARDGAGAGTGTVYLHATSPLGAWQGTGVGGASIGAGSMMVDGTSAVFKGPDATAAQTMSTLKNYDLTFAATPLPDTHSTWSTHYGQIGWMFRATDQNNGYLWVLSTRPYKGAPARLTKYILVKNHSVKTTIVPVKTRVSMTTASQIRTRVVGNKFQTWLNRRLIDTTKGARYTQGYTAIREYANQAAYYYFWSVTDPATHQLYAGDNWSEKTLAMWPRFVRMRRTGIPISSDSCGGQPSDVAQLLGPTSSGGNVYLFQSDRWDNHDQNEAQALQYWQPLKFTSTGMIQTLQCTASSTVTLTDAPVSSPSATALNGSDTFNVVQDISAVTRRAQVFTVPQDMTAQHVSFIGFQSDDPHGRTPDAGLTVSIYDADADPALAGVPLWTTTLDPSLFRFAPVTMSPPTGGVPLTATLNGAPHHYALVLSTTATQGFYGTARSDGSYDVDPGQALIQRVDPTTATWAAWGPESTLPMDLRYALSSS